MSSHMNEASKHSAGAFDVRNVIAALIGFYGVVLLIIGFVDSGEAEEKTGGIDANLWAGLGMVLFALAFLLWSRLRPVVVEERPADDDRPPVH